MEANNNTMHSMTTESFGDSKLSRVNEINPSMSIAPTGADSYTQKIKSLGGSN